MQFNKWTVIEYIGKNEKGRHVWLCECSCENKTRKILRGDYYAT